MFIAGLNALFEAFGMAPGRTARGALPPRPAGLPGPAAPAVAETARTEPVFDAFHTADRPGDPAAARFERPASPDRPQDGLPAPAVLDPSGRPDPFGAATAVLDGDPSRGDLPAADTASALSDLAARIGEFAVPDAVPAVLPADSPLAATAVRFGLRLPELAFEPGLVAAVDQHAAAVRDAAAAEPDFAVGLTDYVLGFTDALVELGWAETAGYDYAALRLTAVAWLLRERGFTIADS